MKQKIMLSLLAILTALPTMAQYNRRPYRPAPAPQRGYYTQRSYAPRSSHSPIDVYYGLRLGLGVSTVSSDDRFLDGGSAKSGLNLGAVVGVQVAPATPLYFESGLIYAEKGGKGSADGRSFSYSLDYLEVPFLIKYQHDFDRLASIQPFAGVYGALGVGGKMRDFNQRHTYSVFDDEGFRRFDGGVRLGCGFQFSHLYAELGCDLGLANISRDYFDTATTGSFFANVGVNF